MQSFIQVVILVARQAEIHAGRYAYGKQAGKQTYLQAGWQESKQVGSQLYRLYVKL